MPSTPIIYDSSEIHFSLKVFVLQFLVHFFCPLFLWLSPNLKVQGFYNMEFSYIFFNYLIHFATVAMMWCSYMSPTNIEGNGSAMWVPLMLYITQRLMVAFKYSTLTKSEYNRLMTCKDPDLINEYVAQIQIILGVIGGNRTLMQYEVAASAAKLGFINLDKFRFYVPIAKHEHHLPGSAHSKSPNITAEMICYASSMEVWEKFISPCIAEVDVLAKVASPSRGAIFQSSQKLSPSNSKSPRVAPSEVTSVDAADEVVAFSAAGDDGNKDTPQTKAAGAHEQHVEEVDSLLADMSKEKAKYATGAGAKGKQYFVKTATGNGDKDPCLDTGAAIGLPESLNHTNSIPLTVVALGLITNASKIHFKVSDVMTWVGVVAVFSLVVQPFFVAYQDPYEYQKRHPGEDPDAPIYSIVFYITTTLLTIVFSPVITAFLSGTVIDMAKRRVCALALADMIRPYRAVDNDAALFFNLRSVDNDICEFGHLLGIDEDDMICEPRKGISKNDLAPKVPEDHPLKNVPIIDFQASPKNVECFMNLRLMMMNYGMRFRFRFDIYLGALIEAAIILMVLVLMMVNTTSDITQITDRVLFRQSMILVGLLTIFTILNILIGADINHIYREHMKSVMAHMGMTNSRITHCSGIIKQITRKQRHHEQEQELIQLQKQKRDLNGETSAAESAADNKGQAAAIAKSEDLARQLMELEDTVEHLRLILEALQMAQASIEKSNELLYLRIFGIECSYQYAYSVATSVFTFYVYLVAAMQNSSPDDATL